MLVGEYSTTAPEGYTTFADACEMAGGTAKGTQADLEGYENFAQFCQCRCEDDANNPVDLPDSNQDGSGGNNGSTLRVLMADGTKAVPSNANAASRYFMPDKSVVHTFCCDEMMHCAAGSPVCSNGTSGAHVCK